MYEIDKRQFGQFLSQLRKEKGLTQRELASELYISDKAVSKWETGQSLPDITLLTPLSELLGVTVAELLACKRLASAPMEPEQVEDLLQKATQFADPGPERAQPKGMRLAVYLTCLFAALIELAVMNALQIPLTESLLVSVLLPACFGAYFWLFIQTRLPGYYDQNQIGSWSDGPFRMNIPGVRFTNRNWPYIVRTLRIWSALTMTLYPLIYLAGSLILPDQWSWLQLYTFLAVIIGGMFVPLMIVGRKYQ